MVQGHAKVLICKRNTVWGAGEGKVKNARKVRKMCEKSEGQGWS